MDHALKIDAEDQMEKFVVAMYPHLKPSGRSKLMSTYRRRANGQSNTTPINATIEKDRAELRRLLYGKK